MQPFLSYGQCPVPSYTDREEFECVSMVSIVVRAIEARASAI